MAEKIEITFLGTGSSIPTAKKNHTAIFVSWGSINILVDCGEGTQRQFKIAKINPCKLTHLLITHWHADHTIGIPGLLETLHMSEYSKTLHIYGPTGTKHKLKLFENIYGKFKLKHKVHEISTNKISEEKNFNIESSQMSHGIPTLAYSIIIKEKLRLSKKAIAKHKLPNSPLLGKLQQGKNISYDGKIIKAKSVTYSEPLKKITIVMDTAPNSKAINLARGSDLLISESSFTSDQLEQATKYKHLTVADAATIAKKAKVKQLVLTHNSQRYSNNIKPIIQEAKKIFKNSRLVDDFDKITI